MERSLTAASPRRTLLAICAALGGISIAVRRHHVHIVLSDPATYASPIHHRCGLLMLACVSWALFEMTLLFAPDRIARTSW